MLAELSNLSSADRPLAMRMRPDLECRQISMRGRPQWSIKDPLARRFYQLREEEFFVLRQLDGRISMAEIGRRFEARFAPRRLAPLRLQSYLGMLHRSGLVVADAPRQGEELLDRRKRLVRESWLETATNLLSLRFRGVNPDRFLGWLEPRLPLDFHARIRRPLRSADRSGGLTCGRSFRCSAGPPAGRPRVSSAPAISFGSWWCWP